MARKVKAAVIRPGGRLNDRQERFCQEYVVDFNATRAYLAAGYAEGGARAAASKLLANANVQERIRQLAVAATEGAGVSAQRVVEEIARVAFANIGDVAEWGVGGVRPKESASLTPDVLAAVAEVSDTANGLRVKMAPKLAALELLARRLGLLTDKVDHTSSDGSMTPADAPLTDDEIMREVERRGIPVRPFEE